MNNIEKTDKKNGYAAVRFNAVKHGILSRETILPHESHEDYESCSMNFARNMRRMARLKTALV